MLVIRFSSLGDILLTAPALRSLRARFPESPIDLLVAAEYADAARLIPGPDRVLTFDRSEGFGGLWRLRGQLARRYAVLVDLQNSPRSAFLRATTLPVIWTKAKRYRLRRWLLIRFKKNLYGGVKAVPERYLDAMARLGAIDDEPRVRAGDTGGVARMGRRVFTDAGTGRRALRGAVSGSAACDEALAGGALDGIGAWTAR